MEIDEEVPDLTSEVDLPELEAQLVLRLSDDLTRIRTIYRRGRSICAMVVGWPWGVASSGFYDLMIEITSPFQEGKPVWPFTVWEEMDLLAPDERWDVHQVMVNSPTRKSRSCTVTLRRIPFRRRRDA